jgi:hypothetical protein
MTIRATVLGLIVASVATFATTDGWGQEKKKFSFKAPPGLGKYTQNHVIDVRDVPGHQLRIFELRTAYTDVAPEFDGVKVKESWAHGFSDYINGSGAAMTYGVSLMENGDKVYSRTAIHSQTVTAADGSKQLTFRTVQTLTGGTGRFTGIRGVLLGGGTSDLKTAVVDAGTQGEYWIEK